MLFIVVFDCYLMVNKVEYIKRNDVPDVHQAKITLDNCNTSYHLL